jgi:4-hydroxy-3-methylbut-2-enyl diphosphate reductase
VLRLLERGDLDVMIVIGGYHSSNTIALARICAAKLPTFHISGPDCLEGNALRHRPIGAQAELQVANWLPAGAVRVGLTAGASTPNNVVGLVVEKILALRGLETNALAAA